MDMEHINLSTASNFPAI